ncbi:fumarylacetoacetate hydrolase family protein [Acidiphilium sp. C61]|jgi:fumarylpyruvate hydrolase|uniref:fumarylacetoacetate hydrolase family protein n=1 Tax=Acidiphilium sp. C61 TaxID=1671485 RepID=UPI00157B4417|nr:fumarylacetoacetate hydrolase family protein [Acidiphilium sp. C61]
MLDFVIAPPATPAVPVAGGGYFPIRRIFCVGRNYAAHTREMGGDPNREPPFFFTKPADAIVVGDSVPFPSATDNLHHEMELVVALGSGGRDIPPGAALDHVYGYAAGVDLTRRDLQDEAKSLRRPWDMSKGFDHSAPVGPIAPSSRVGHPASGRISLTVNGEQRQNGDLSDMIWPVADIIACLSSLVELMPGDLIFTGTPDGVGQLRRGDRIAGVIDGIGQLEFTLA